ncbi:VWA domain-containing protein [Natronococcus pandeyae]|uniref:VWA domain-containing protein n=1 Tax=Natronococcus pandeyae TaxID=2055836 RepID=UPI001653380A|nr:VWA domain-containing protein [Natronococcus pandeyae]
MTGGTESAALEAVRDHVLSEVVTFADALRAEGATVPPTATVTAARAVAALPESDETRVRAALRTTLVSQRADIDAFERLFPVFWENLTGSGTDESSAASDGTTQPFAVPQAGESNRDGRDRDETGESIDRTERAQSVVPESNAPADGDDESDTERDDGHVFRALSTRTGRSERLVVDDIAIPGADVREPLERIGRALGRKRGRRLSDDPAGSKLNVRRTLRRSFGTGGTVLEVDRRSYDQTAVNAIVLVDVSRSVLDSIDRGFLLGVLRQMRADWRSVRVFFFDTSLREVTAQFDEPSSDRAIAALERAETEWGGGTRIGHALSTLRTDYADAVDRETAVLVISDGLEVGELDRLERGMVWLSRRADSVLWLNPLAVDAEYEPTCRGMAVASPYVDGLFGFARPADLEEIARQLSLRGVHGRIGYVYDGRGDSARRPRGRGWARSDTASEGDER